MTIRFIMLLLLIYQTTFIVQQYILLGMIRAYYLAGVEIGAIIYE